MKKYVSLVLCLLLAALLFTGCAGGNGGSSGGGKTSDAAVNEALLGCFGKSADEAVKALGLKDDQKAGDYGYTLDWLAPESIPLFLGANLHAAALSKGLTLKEALEAVGSITDPMLQMSMLQGVNDALENASTYGDESALPRFVENAM